MSAQRSTQVALSALMNLILILAVLIVVKVIVQFFGALAAYDISRALVSITDPVTLPLGIAVPRTPYGGVFDSDAAVTVVVLLALEWGLSVARFRG